MSDRSTLTNPELDRLHGYELSVALGISSTELARVRELHRQEWVGRTEPSSVPLKRSQALDDQTSPNHPTMAHKTVQSASVRICRDCSSELPKQTSKGRPAVRCDSCKTKLETEKVASKKTHNVCSTCSKKFPLTGKRGRQPANCPKCARKLSQAKG